jgi:E1A-binding protein p400
LLLAADDILREAEQIQAMYRPPPAQHEPPRNKVHWDYVLEEAVWLATDFHEERKAKMATARKVARAVVKWHEERDLALRRLAATMARDVRAFWKRVGDLVRLRRQLTHERERKEEMSRRMDQLFDRTEQFSSMIARGLAAGPDEPSAAPAPAADSDSDSGSGSASDTTDEEGTLAAEEALEAAEATEATSRAVELELLRQEGELPLEQVLARRGGKGKGKGRRIHRQRAKDPYAIPSVCVLLCPPSLGRSVMIRLSLTTVK